MVVVLIDMEVRWEQSVDEYKDWCEEESEGLGSDGTKNADWKLEDELDVLRRHLFHLLEKYTANLST